MITNLNVARTRSRPFSGGHQQELAEAYLAELKGTLTARVEAGDLKPPIDNSALYEKYLGMFSRVTDETLTFDAETYGCVFDDNWSWAVTVKFLNSTYAASRRR